jgi:quercetin dioxygenase-like cupin family protein
MVFPHKQAVAVEAMPGGTRRLLATSEAMMVIEFTFETGVGAPHHNHPHDQVGYVVSGRVRMVIDGQASECGPGDSYHAPPNVYHSGEALEPTVVIDVFSPPREDYR